MVTRKIEVVPYNPEWTSLFAQEATRLRDLFADNLIAIHHIGSTAVPGMPAKPIVDILIEVKDIDRMDVLQHEMEQLGYLPKGEFGIPGRRFFINGDEIHRTHHIHVFGNGHPRIADHLAFRDFLIAHPNEASTYAQLKQNLAKEFPDDIEGYMSGKHGFIKDIISRIEAEK